MFLTPAILAGLLAIGLPLWLHRVARANPVQHPFASLMLIEASETQRTARRTLRYWLLLMLRILLLIALVLAFAGPLLPPRAVPAVNGNARLHVIALDTSLSMQQGDHWQRAVTEARDVIDSARTGDRLLLVEAAGRRIRVVGTPVPASQRAVVRAALEGIEPGSERLDYGLMMSTASAWLGAVTQPVELHLISDLQQTATPLRFADLEPPAGMQPVFHDVSRGESANTYIKSVQRERAEQLAVEVRSSATSVRKLEVVLSVDGKESARRPLQIGPAMAQTTTREGEGAPREPPSQTREVQARVLLPLPASSASAQRVEVRLEPGDALPQDDRYYTVLERADPRVLVVSRTTEGDDAVYVAAAIGSLSKPRVSVEQRAARQLGTGALQFAAMVITDMAALDSASSARIADYVRAGGAALVMLGPGMTDQRNGLLAGLSLRNVASTATRVAQMDTSHPALRDTDGWQDIHFLKYLRVEPAASDKVLIALQGGAPLLMERSLGAGRLLVLTAPLARDWNDFATQPLFVTFMAQATQWLTGAGAATRSARVGAVVTTGLTAAQGGQIFDPQGRRVLNLDQTASAERLIPEATGFYEIRTGNSARWLAVNSDVRESDLTPLPATSLQRWRSMARPAPRVVTKDAVATSAPVSIGYGLLLLALVLMVVQMLTANHFLAVRREVPR